MILWQKDSQIVTDRQTERNVAKHVTKYETKQHLTYFDGEMIIPSLLRLQVANSHHSSVSCQIRSKNQLDWKIELLENLHTWENKILGNHEQEGENEQVENEKKS